MTAPIMKYRSYIARITYDPEIEMFRGEVVNIASHIDFLADSVGALKEEFVTSVDVYLETCQEEGIAPEAGLSGKFNVRIEPTLHAVAKASAAAEGQSLNAWVADAIREKSGVIVLDN